jgi:hypothetical protein
MAITLLNVGSGPNTGDGDFWRDAGIKANANFTSLQTSITTLQTSISGYAPLASPPFTGTPTAPTAAGGTNTTQLATTAFVTGALGSYLTTSVAAATYAVLGGSGAAFTVSPTVPTPSIGDNTTKAINSAWVTTKLSTYSAPMPVGSLLNANMWEYATNADLTTIIPLDDTIPTNTEGVQILSQTWTPASATNRIEIEFECFGASGTADAYRMMAAVFLDGTCIRATASNTGTGVDLRCAVRISFLAGSTTTKTVTVRVGPSAAGTIRLNGTTAARVFGGTAAATLSIREYVA